MRKRLGIFGLTEEVLHLCVELLRSIERQHRDRAALFVSDEFLHRLSRLSAHPTDFSSRARAVAFAQR